MKADNFLDYKNEARHHWMHWTLLLSGSFFVAVSFLIDPQTQCVEYDCPLWLRSLAGGTGLFFALSALYAIIRNWQWGSRVDLATGTLIWWEGYPPVHETKIQIADIQVIHLADRVGDPDLKLSDSNGTPIRFPAECAPCPWVDWAEALKKSYPHIQLVQAPNAAKIKKLPD